MDLLDSDSEGEEERRKNHGGAGAEIAHMGMLPPTSTTAAADLENGKKGSKQKSNKRESSGVGGMSLAEQEALALKLLRQGK